MENKKDYYKFYLAGMTLAAGIAMALSISSGSYKKDIDVDLISKSRLEEIAQKKPEIFSRQDSVYNKQIFFKK